MKTCLITLLTFMMITQTAWSTPFTSLKLSKPAKSSRLSQSFRYPVNRHMVRTDIDGQTLFTFKRGNRLYIVSNDKCDRNTLCNRGKTVIGMIHTHDHGKNTRFNTFYQVNERRFEWVSAMIQEWQDHGRVDVFVDRISDSYSSVRGSYQPYNCDMPGEYTVPSFDLMDVEDFLGTSMIPMEEIFGKEFDPTQLDGYIDFAMEMGDSIQGQVSLELGPFAVAGLVILGAGVATTVSEFSSAFRQVDDALANGSDNQVSSEDQARARKRAIKATQVVSEYGYGAPSTVYTALAKYFGSDTECRQPDDELIRDLLF